MDNQNRTEWIDQYLLGELKDNELIQFKQQMKTDANFRQEVEVQKALFLQARKVGRDAMREQLKDMHQRLELSWPVESTLRTQQKPVVLPVPNRKRFRNFQYYTIAASITLLLIASLIGYFLYTGSPPNTIAQRKNATGTKSVTPRLFYIRLEQSGATQNFGFGGTAGTDTTVAVLIYPAEKGGKSYQFDDTLRLYGSFVPARLSLRYDQNTGQYIIREDSVWYPLQRYRVQQALKPAR